MEGEEYATKRYVFLYDTEFDKLKAYSHTTKLVLKLRAKDFYRVLRLLDTVGVLRLSIWGYLSDIPARSKRTSALSRRLSVLPYIAVCNKTQLAHTLLSISKDLFSSVSDMSAYDNLNLPMVEPRDCRHKQTRVYFDVNHSEIPTTYQATRLWSSKLSQLLHNRIQLEQVFFKTFLHFFIFYETTYASRKPYINDHHIKLCIYFVHYILYY